MQARALSGGLIAKVILVAAAVVGGLYLLFVSREIVGLLLIAVFFAVAMAPPVNWLDEHRLPRAVAGGRCSRPAPRCRLGRRCCSSAATRSAVSWRSSAGFSF